MAERFLRYVQIDTQSDPDATTTPSTAKQKDLSRLLVQELLDLGISDAYMDEYGYVFGTLPGTQPDAAVLALLAHVDTSFDESGTHVKPQVHPNYHGGVIALPGDPSVRLDPASDPALLAHIGHDLITSDGTTLLGSDDKAGVAVIMQCAADLLHDEAPRPTLRLCFTIDEEIGRGVDKLDLDVLGAEVAYTLDGSGTDNLSAETFNAASADVRIQGRMVHPGYAEGIMVNALRIAAECIAALPADEAPEATSGYEGYYYASRMRSAEVHQAEVHILLRDFTDAGMQRRKDDLTTLIESLRLKHPGANISLEIRDQYHNMYGYIQDRDPRTITFAQATAHEMGFELEMEPIRGGTDGARLSERGLPTPNLFTGGHQFHSKYEWNTVQNLERSLAFLKRLVRYWGENG